VRWDRLFDDLEAQLGHEQARERDAEVADRTRRERAQLDLQARLLANLDAAQVGLRLPTRTLSGRLTDVGPDWLLVEDAGRQVIVAMAAVRAVRGLQPGARIPSVVAKSFRLGAALRAVSRDRATVELVDVDGTAFTGTIDVVGADHVEVALHPTDASRRQANLVGRHVIPFWALGTVSRL
jgi:hypothetical protein